MKLRIADIVNDSIVDGPGLRLTVFAQGCFHACEGCHNPQTHDINGGYLTDTDEILSKISKNPLLDGITFSGGEPFLQAEAFAYLAKAVRTKGLSVMVNTGYTWEELLSNPAFISLVKEADLIAEGKFVKELRTLDMPFVGSSNQRVIAVQESLNENKPVLFKFS